MKKTLLSICACLLFQGYASAADVTPKLDSMLKEEPIFFGMFAESLDTAISKNVDDVKFLLQPLSAEDANEVSDFLFKKYQKELKVAHGKEWGNKVLKIGDLKMPFETRVAGEKPDNGRSLYISMHGGGNAPASLNTQQWMNQIMLYSPEEGVYIAPRAPFDDWNMWFRPEMTEFFDRLIQLAVIDLDVSPDKVYLMGYSAGGDGVYRMAPRMADRWAAASMMAGHPGDVTPLNLRNIGFSLWVGANDSGYDRNKMAADFSKKLEEVKKADPDGYTYDVHIVKGKSHWMDREDAAAIPWMAQFTRNPYPKKVSWRQEESDYMPTSFYWLSVPKESTQKGNTVIVERDGNTFNILKCDYPTLTINVNDAMINFDQPVRVLMDGKELFNGKIKRSMETIYDTLKARGDRAYIFSAKVTVKTKEK